MMLHQACGTAGYLLGARARLEGRWSTKALQSSARSALDVLAPGSSSATPAEALPGSAGAGSTSATLSWQPGSWVRSACMPASAGWIREQDALLQACAMCRLRALCMRVVAPHLCCHRVEVDGHGEDTGLAALPCHR